MKIDYEQQRLHLLHKHGIDLEDSTSLVDGKKTRRMDPKEAELLMGGGDGQGGVFTWREKHRRKVGYLRLFLKDSLEETDSMAQLAYSVYVLPPSSGP